MKKISFVKHILVELYLTRYSLTGFCLLMLCAIILLLMPHYVCSAQTIDLPQTGQTKCYNSSGSDVVCNGTGQDGEFKKGVAWPTPRFVISGDCITDRLTGLMWTKNANLSKESWQGSLEYVASLNGGAGQCGYKDWRLPNVNELANLVNAGEADSSTWLNSQGFNNVQSADSAYWTSSVYDTTNSWVVWMDGYVTYGDTTYFAFLWPVRSGQSGVIQLAKTGQTVSYASGDDGNLQKGIPWAVPRFTDNGNQTVKDNLTGLIWTKDAYAPGPAACSPATDKTWQEALDYVKCLNTYNYLGSNDWRLPNRNELRSLLDYSRSNPALPAGHAFTNVKPYYWSSSTAVYQTSRSFYLNMDYGQIGEDLKAYYAYVWPVSKGFSIGDMNRDQTVSLADAILALQICANFSSSGAVNKVSEVNADGKIGMADAVYVLQWIAGLRNRPPELAAIGNKTTTIGSALTFTISASDADSDSMSYVASNLPAGASFNPATRIFTWTPTSLQVGTYPIIFTVRDVNGFSDAETITVTVNSLTPVSFSTADLAGTWYLNIGGTKGLTKGQLSVNSSGQVTGGAFTAIDSNGDHPGTFTAGSISIDSNGVMSGTINGNVTGLGSITVTIRSGKMDSSKGVMAFIDTTSDGNYQVGVATKGGGSFSTADLAGAWHLNIGGTKGLTKGQLTVNSSGLVTGSSFLTIDPYGEYPGTFTGGSISIDGSGVMSGIINGNVPGQGNITVTVRSGKMESSKGSMVFIDTTSDGNYQAGVATKGGGSFSTADLAGTWHLHIGGTEALTNGQLSVNSSGQVTGGTFSDIDLYGVYNGTFTGGSISIDGSGVISGTVNGNVSGQGITVTIRSGKMDSSKGSMAFIDTTSDGNYQAGVAIKR